MLLTENIQSFINLFVIVFLCLIPVFLFKKSIRETFFIFLALVLFLLLNKSFFWGASSAYHDTFWGPETFFNTIRLWVGHGLYPGWNPYVNGGEPIYLFSNFILPLTSLFFYLTVPWENISSHLFFNQCWTFIFLNFCIGCFLLFRTLFDDFKVAFFCFVAILLSGLFKISLGQPSGLYVLSCFPFIVFGVLIFVRKKSPYGIMFALIYTGIALNYYNPMYIFFVLLLFLTALSIFMGLPYVKTAIVLARQHYKIIALGLFVAILAAAPAIFWNFELKDFVCPTRGAFAPGGAINLDKVGTQPRVIASFSNYRILLDRMFQHDFRAELHHAFYFGIMPLLLIPIALFRLKNKLAWVFFTTAVLAVFIGTGNKFMLSFLYKYFPWFKMLRHTFQFAQFVPILLVCVSGFGLKVIFSENRKAGLKTFLICTVSALAICLVTKDKITIVLTISNCLAILCSILLLHHLKNRENAVRFAKLFIFSMLILDLYFFNIKQLSADTTRSPYIQLPEQITVNQALEYPLKRTLYASKTPPIPVDFFPIFLQEASLTSPREDLIMFRSSRLNDMLQSYVPQAGYDCAFGVGEPIFYYTTQPVMLPKNFSKEQVIKAVYSDCININQQKRKVYLYEKDIDFLITDKNNLGLRVETLEFPKDRRNLNMLELTIDVPADGFLVRLENFHHGWQAYVDGVRVKIYRANYAFQTIFVSAGRHKIVFKFQTIYPVLLLIHIILVTTVWLLLNYYLYKAKEKPGIVENN